MPNYTFRPGESVRYQGGWGAYSATVLSGPRRTSYDGLYDDLYDIQDSTGKVFRNVPRVSLVRVRGSERARPHIRRIPPPALFAYEEHPTGEARTDFDLAIDEALAKNRKAVGKGIIAGPLEGDRV